MWIWDQIFTVELKCSAEDYLTLYYIKNSHLKGRKIAAVLLYVEYMYPVKIVLWNTQENLES